MLINLFDNTWRGDACSVRGKTAAHVQYVRDQPRWSGVSLFVDGFAVWDDPDQVESPVKLAWLHEPRALIPSVYDDILARAGRFERVLTYDARLLAELPNASFVPGGGVWIERAEWGLRPKTRLCSLLLGDKLATDGHRLRPQVADALAGLPLDLYGARGTPVGYGAGAKLAVLGDYAFSVAVINCREPNYFDDWLLDCFAVGTIPILWGCPNVGDFFDARGVLSFQTLAEVYAIVRGLTWRLYQDLLPHAAENLGRVADYEITDDWLYAHVLGGYEMERVLP